MNKTILTILVFCFAVFSVNAQIGNKTTTTATQKSAAAKANQKSAAVKANQKRAAAKANQTNPQADNPNAPVITFDKMVHDYGIMAVNADGNCEFKFTNEGKEPLILSNVRASWGCTVPAWPRKPVLPGESDVIVVKYNTKKVGKINKSITVTSNAKQPKISLRIKGEVKPASSTATAVPGKKLDNSGAPVNK